MCEKGGGVYLTDARTDWIQVFDSQGRFLRKWGTEGDGDGYFDYPTGVAIVSKENVYAVESPNNHNQMFDPQVAPFTNGAKQAAEMASSIGRGDWL